MDNFIKKRSNSNIDIGGGQFKDLNNEIVALKSAIDGNIGTMPSMN